MTYTTISETVAAYDSMLDECYPDLTIAEYAFDTARALDQLDPLAYKCGWLDWCDSEGIDTDDLEDDYTFSRDRL